MNRITITFDTLGFIQRICSDDEVEVYVVSPPPSVDRVYRMSMVEVGQHHLDEELGTHPVGSRDVFPSEEAQLAFEARMEVIRKMKAVENGSRTSAASA
ncbi:MAG TPA: hypothetical protein VGN83_16025 [Falsiroseomonas sp.]|jgi:hypothetical protein|nr:hypothetical protein [Falsiroseomonas sp.]